MLLRAGQQRPSGPARAVTATTAAKAPDDAPKQVSIDLDKAIAVKLATGANLKPVAFRTTDGKDGWALRIPGDRPIATPAYADGKIFVGGGYGSHEFYAFDAQSGALLWQMKTSDDGPTAAVVEDGYVVFNTESCTLIVVDAKTGKVIWQKWLGDPLMSQPAVWKGRVYIAYPANPRGPKAANPGVERDGRHPRTSHRLLCLDLKTGEPIWEQDITGDAITAPVIADGNVYVNCFDGTSFAFNALDGTLLWRKQLAGTSAPVIAQGQMIIGKKETRGGKAYEGMARVDAQRGNEKDKEALAQGDAEYLAKGKGGGVALAPSKAADLDSSVGFGTPPASAQLAQANDHVGVSTVAGAWAYQGSKVSVNDGRMLNAQGRYINSVNAHDGKRAWRAEVRSRELAGNAQMFSPPALGREKMYLSGAAGHIIAVQQKDGEAVFIYAFGKPMVFQPALARGNIYAGTQDGWLICLKTGSADADGWYAWGGNAQHSR